MQKTFPLLPLFEQFIRDSTSGRRVKANGQRIKPQTVDNYRYTLKLLSAFSETTGFELRIRPVARMDQRKLKVEMNYWKRFYRLFSEYLYKARHCYDNYIGHVFKMIKVFFSYLSKDKLIQVGDFYRKFYIKKEEIPIIALMPEQLHFLISDREFDSSLNKVMKRTKDIFVFGCTVALRISDIFNVRFKDIHLSDGSYYLSARSLKTDVSTQVKLPSYVMEIVNRYRKGRSATSTIFPSVCRSQFNRHVRSLAEKAGWVDVVGKARLLRGKTTSVLVPLSRKAYRFCDLLSSHTMRRTAVTTMLMLGMPEHAVRKVSGHSSSSRAFYRYVGFSQRFMDQEIDKVHQKLVAG